MIKLERVRVVVVGSFDHDVLLALVHTIVRYVVTEGTRLGSRMQHGDLGIFRTDTVPTVHGASLATGW